MSNQKIINIKKLRNIKLVVSDLDGTLLSDDGIVGEESKELIKELRNYGVQFSFATGRLYSAVKHFANELEIDNPIISLDGSYIVDYPTNETIFESFVKEKYVKKAIMFAENYLLQVALCHADAIYYTDSNSVIPKMLDKFGAKYQPVDSYENYMQNTLEIVYSSDLKESVKYVRDRFEFPFAIGCSTSYFRSHTHEGLYYLEIRKAGSNKGKGLKRLLKHMEIKPQEVVVMGDWYNDISMFELKTMKVAVANSVPEIIRLADYVTIKTNREDGVASFLKMLLKAKKG
ncbi:MAG: HAD family hydrolase [Ignavibacterium sp.]|nr:MAG: HAD family hydrolase [Ignavibacterium sp.]